MKHKNIIYSPAQKSLTTSRIVVLSMYIYVAHSELWWWLLSPSIVESTFKWFIGHCKSLHTFHVCTLLVPFQSMQFFSFSFPWVFTTYFIFSFFWLYIFLLFGFVCNCLDFWEMSLYVSTIYVQYFFGRFYILLFCHQVFSDCYIIWAGLFLTPRWRLSLAEMRWPPVSIRLCHVTTKAYHWFYRSVCHGLLSNVEFVTIKRVFYKTDTHT